MTLLLRMTIIGSLAGLTTLSCGKKSSDDNSGPAPAANADVAADTDQRIFGSWLLRDLPVKDEKTGVVDASHTVKLVMAVAKDKVTMSSELYFGQTVICKAEVSTTNFKLTKTTIVVNEPLTASVATETNDKCSVSLNKSSSNYSFESDAMLIMAHPQQKEALRARRLK